MIVLPWFVRFGLDCTIALTPAIYLHYHPTTFFFEYFQNRRRIIRRKTYDNFQYINQEPTISQEQSKKIFEELKLEQ